MQFKVTVSNSSAFAQRTTHLTLSIARHAGGKREEDEMMRERKLAKLAHFCKWIVLSFNKKRLHYENKIYYFIPQFSLYFIICIFISF